MVTMEFGQRLQAGSSALPTQGTLLFESCARRLYSDFVNVMSEARRHGDCSQSEMCGRGLARSVSKMLRHFQGQNYKIHGSPQAGYLFVGPILEFRTFGS
jgi:hypothetical protein